MRGKFWISSILAAAVGAALPPEVIHAQPAPAQPATPSPTATVDPIQQALAALSDLRTPPDPRISVAAARLVAMRTPQSRAAIRQVLMDNRVPQSQIAVAQALADDPDPDRDPGYVDPLFTMLSGPISSGIAAAQTLGIYKVGSEHAQVLTQLINTAKGVGTIRSSDSARRAATIALGQMVDKPAAQTLMDLLTSPNEAQPMHDVAAEALGAMSGDSRIGRDVQGWKRWWADYQDKSDPQFRDEILATKATQLAALKRRQSDLESDYCAMLDDVYHSAQTPEDRGKRLEQYLTSPNPVVRAEGARIVYNDKTQGLPLPPADKVQTQLLNIIGDSDPRVRLAAVNALAVLNDRTALKPLIAQLQQEQDPGVRAALALALGQIGDIQAVDTLLPLLSDSRDVVVAAAAKALAAFGPQLQNISRQQARQAAKQLQQILDRTAMNDSGTQNLRDAIMSAMAELSDETLLPTFKTVLNDQNEPPSMKQRAIKGIGNLKDEKSADDIGRRLKDPDNGIKLAAVNAITQVNGVGSAQQLVDMLQPGAEDPAIQAAAWTALQSFLPLPQLDNATLQNFADRFKQDDPAKRRDILRALADKQLHDQKTDQKIDERAYTLQNIGETDMDDRIADYSDALAQFDAAISSLSSINNNKPNGARMVPLYRLRLQASLRTGKYHDSIDLAQDAVQKQALDAGEAGALIKTEVETLVKEANQNAALLEKAKDLIDESNRLDLPPNSRDNLSTLKDQIQQQIAKNKGATEITPDPQQIDASISATAQRDRSAVDKPAINILP